MTCQHGQRTMTSSDISDYRIECGSQSALTCAPDRTKLKCTQPRTSPKLSSGEEYGWWFLVPKVIKLYNIPTHYQNPFWWVFPSTLVFNKKGWQYILLLLLLSQKVMSDSLWPHELKHARLPCPSLPPGACSVQFSSVKSLSHVQLFAVPWTAACQASLSITNSWSLPKPMSIESVMPSSHLILCRPLLLPPSIFPSTRVFSNESALRMRWPKYWSFSFNISPTNEHRGLISFRMDWLDLPAVQGTLKSFLQHHSSKASILQRSAFFIVQLSHPYMTTGKTIALTRWTFVDIALEPARYVEKKMFSELKCSTLKMW